MNNELRLQTRQCQVVSIVLRADHAVAVAADAAAVETHICALLTAQNTNLPPAAEITRGTHSWLC